MMTDSIFISMIKTIKIIIPLAKPILLSGTIYTIKKGKKWARLDSNQRPSDYESPALTTAPRALKQSSGQHSAFITGPNANG